MTNSDGTDTYPRWLKIAWWAVCGAMAWAMAPWRPPEALFEEAQRTYSANFAQRVELAPEMTDEMNHAVTIADVYLAGIFRGKELG